MINIKSIFRKKDIIIITILLVIALAVSMYNYLQPVETDVYALIYVEGDLIETKLLTEDIQTIDITTNSGAMEIIIINNRLFVNSSTCTSKQCMRKGKIYKAGQSIYCDANHVLIKLTDEIGLEAAQ